MNVPSAPQEDLDIGKLYSGTFVKAADLGGKTYSAVIANVEIVELPTQNGAVEQKAALTLHNWPARLVLNKVNYETIAAAYGRGRLGWLGKPLEIFPATASFAGRTVPAIRVRVPAPLAPAAAVPGAPTPVAAPATPAEPVTPIANAAPPVQQHMLPPLMTAAEFNEDIPY